MAIGLEQFHQTFFEESFEGLDTMESGLLNLQEGQPDLEVVNTIFRAAHSIKGGSGTFGFADVAKFTHVLETMLNEMRDGRRQVTPEAVTLLLESVDCLREMLSAVRGGAAVNATRVADVHSRLESMLGTAGAPKVAAAPAAAKDTVPAVPAGWEIRFRPGVDVFRTGNDPLRILRELGLLGEMEVRADTGRLPEFDKIDPESSFLGWNVALKTDAPLAQVNELFDWVRDESELEIKPAGGPPAPAATAAAGPASAIERRAGADRRAPAAEGASIRVDTAKVDALINMVGELVITQTMLKQVGDNFEMGRLQKLYDGLADLERNTRELQESVMRIRMLPISVAFNRIPRLVHDLSAKFGKKVELKMTGEQTELDKTVLEQIVDPLVHLVRNALDHGIEAPEVRVAGGKPETGTLALAAYHKSGNVVIEIGDDGAGLNTEKILKKARERGLVKPDEVLTEEQMRELLFLPGFSTADVVSDVSGRGVGMDVVRKNVQKLGGTVEVSSERGKGSRFTVRLPLTLAIMDGQSVAVGKEFYIVPLVSIVVSTQVRPGTVNLVAGKGEVFRFRDEYLPVVRLHEVFGATPRAQKLEEGLLVVVEADGRRVGLFVDELLGQQQAVVKSLEANYRRVEGISGATILGDGSVALILDVPGLIRIAQQQQAA
jgi:two-component system, chemotaxis family, sensor kinase CheA